jgi:DNA invertase Pin-like site-specific DNA recombinase
LKTAIYARVSTNQQELDHQIEACRSFCAYKQYEIGAEFAEKISTVKANRPELLKLLKALRQREYEGVVVFRLDRLGRNARELSLNVEELENKGIRVLSVSESYDTSTAIGRAMREIIFILAQLEREQIGESTKQRLASLKAAGKKLGRPPASDYQVQKVRGLDRQGFSVRKIAGVMQISYGTVYNIVKQKGYYSGLSKTDEV